MCQTDAFFQKRIREATFDDNVESYGTFIDWEFDATSSAVTVSFLSNTTSSTGSPVPPLFITTAMLLSPTDINEYISEYVLAATLPEGNLFLGTAGVSFNNRLYEGQVLPTELIRATCPYVVPEVPATASPTVSIVDMPLSPTAAPGSPTAAPGSPTAAPGSPTSAPGNTTLSPTVMDGNATASPTVDVTVVDGNTTTRPTVTTTMSPTTASQNTTTLSPTMTTTTPTPTIATESPVGTPEPPEATPPTQAPSSSSETPTAGRRRTASVELAFLVSNLDDITDPKEILQSGLADSWPVFVEEIVPVIASSSSSRRLRRRLASQGHRFLEISYQTDSAEILEVTEEPCGENVREGLICHVALATYTLLLEEGSDPAAVEEEYRTSTDEAVYDGTYYDILQEVDPGSPLYFGTLYPLPPALQLLINFGGDADRAPTTPEIESLICNVHDFVQEELNDLGEETSTVMTDLAWSHTINAEGSNRFELQFVTDSTYIETGEPVESDLILSALTNLDAAETQRLLEDIKNVEFFNVFFKADSLFLQEAQGDPPTLGTLDKLQCPLVTVTPGPTISAAPTQSPAPSMVPTLSPMPSLPVSPTVAPTRAPFLSSPVIPPSQFKSTGVFPVRIEFRVSNLDDITDPQEVNSKGLSASWPVYAQEIVQNITIFAEPESISKRRRRLGVLWVPGSAKVTDVQPVACSKGSHKDAVCHDAKAEYQYKIIQEILLIANATYYNATNEGLYNGTFQGVLNKEFPGTPLIIGTILPDGSVIPPSGDDGDTPDTGGMDRETDDGSDDGKLPGWAIFLIVLLLLCVCALLVYLYFFFQEGEDDTPSYHDEDFVYDFFIPKGIQVQTEVDDIKSKTVDVEEEEGDGSTASSGSNAMEPFEDEVGDEEVIVEEEDDDWEDGDEETENQNRGVDETEESENIPLLTADTQGDEEKWDDELDDELASGLGTSDYAKEAHRLLLENGDDEDVSSSFILGDSPFADYDEGALAFSDANQLRDPPQEGSMLDPDGASVPMESEDIWQDEDAASTQQPSYGEIVESQDAWGNLEAAVATQQSEDQQTANGDGTDNAEASENVVTSGAEQGDLQGQDDPLRREGSMHASGEWDEETDGGWDDVDDSTSSHPDDHHDHPEDRWA